MLARSLRVPIKMPLHQLAELAFVLYLCIPIMRSLFSILFSFTKWSAVGTTVALIIAYAPVVLLMAMKRRYCIADFWMILIIVVFFFLISYCFHPEYQYWYMREDYGVLNYVLRPDNGLYIYLFIRMVNDPDKILKCLRVSGWPMYAYYGLQTLRAISRGYWIDVSNRGYEIELSYSLSMGYSVLIFLLAFLYSALENKRLMDWFGTGIGLTIILVGGSRGPFLDIAIFLVIYLLIKIANSRRKVLLITAVVLSAVIVWVSYPIVLAGLAQLLNRLGVSSRFLTKLLNGTITESSGRSEIWAAALNMIKKKPLGYGAMGSRHIISSLVYVGHPHQFFLEILIDFGVVVGSVIILWLAVETIKIFNMKSIDAWKGVFLVFFARACQLLVSLTFWHSIGLWGVLAVGVCIHNYKKRGKLEHVG